MLRRFLIIWLTICILGYGMAVTAHIHDESPTDSIHAVDKHVAHHGDTEDASNSDHSCHGIVHLLGLNNTATINSVIDRSIHKVPYAASASSFFPPSLLRPPIAV